MLIQDLMIPEKSARSMKAILGRFEAGKSVVFRKEWVLFKLQEIERFEI